MSKRTLIQAFCSGKVIKNVLRGNYESFTFYRAMTHTHTVLGTKPRRPLAMHPIARESRDSLQLFMSDLIPGGRSLLGLYPRQPNRQKSRKENSQVTYKQEERRPQETHKNEKRRSQLACFEGDVVKSVLKEVRRTI